MSFVVPERPEPRDLKGALGGHSRPVCAQNPGSEQGVVGVSGDVVELDIEI